MSRLGEELAKINEGIGGETTGTSDAALEIKRIIKALDPDASTDGGTLENVIKIRELVESGAGSGGGSSLKSISITNELSYSISVVNYLDENSKYVYPSDGADYPRIEAGETMTVYYPEPAEGSFWLITIGAPSIAMQAEVTGVELDGNEILIYPSADNDVSITIIASGGAS